MASGRRTADRQGEFWVPAPELPTSPGHVLDEMLNELLTEAGFDAWVEELCEPDSARAGRPGIPPGVYFRMLLAGYFEGLGSQRCNGSAARRWNARSRMSARREAPDAPGCAASKRSASAT